ncbi:MAG: hypothetical protein WD696_16730 [Bryobacteraceae bacterium]
MKITAKLLWIGVAALLAGVVLAQRGGRPLEGYESEPGGTPEDRLWQVLVLMGVGDSHPAAWDGRLSIQAGELFEAEGYRFELPDRVLPQGGWRMSTTLERVLFGQGDPRRPVERVLPKGLLLRGAGGISTRVSVETRQGTCEFQPMALDMESARRCLDGRIEVRRVPAVTDLSGTELRQHDFPAIGGGSDGRLWVTWSSFHGQREELNFRRYEGGRWTRLIPVARAAEDLWRPQVATDESGKPWLVWSQQIDGNWDVYAMPWEETGWGERVRLSENPLPDLEPSLARGGDGTLYVVWQALEGRTSKVHLRYRKNGQWSELVRVTGGASNDWEPAVAAGSDGSAWIAWDRYTTSYDVVCRRFTPSRGLEEEIPVAVSKRMEAYASVAVDTRNRPWVAWETGGVNWGKDLGPLSARSIGTALGHARSVEVVVRTQGGWMAPAALSLTDPLEAGANSHSRPLLFADPLGNLWMTFKRRYSRQARNGSTHWETFLTRLTGERWTEPVLLPGSGARKSTRMGMAAGAERLWLFWPSESRRTEFMSRPRLHRVLASSVPMPLPAPEPVLKAYLPAPDDAPEGHADETGDIRAIRSHRVKLGNETLRIVRGDLHRHTELSQDQGGLSDGSLPEFYRYMIDAADMDFGASTDHQAGGTDYWAFMTLKMADMFHFPERFVPLYGYERNLAFPHGHRNILHTRRNYPIVPFFQRPDPKFLLPDSPDGELLTFNSASFGGGIDNDTKLLYEELHKSGGISIPHTSGSSGMGTDWRDNNREIEPLVEIYQGDRHNYEVKNAPRGVRDGEEAKAIGGFQEAGMVWNAWKKGYRLGVIASSDHFSTHISYAMIYTPRQERQAIFDSIRKRHAYGATDNIILEFWMGNHFMGDDFRTTKPEEIRVKVRGTAPIETIHLIRDTQYVHKVQPRTREASLEYLDAGAGPGEHWYYVRVEQSDGELAWSSPIWMTLSR